MSNVHAALLGLSHPHSLAHLRTLQAVSEVESIVLWDPDEDLLQSTVESQGQKIRETTTDLNAVLGQDQILFAVAALRNDRGPAIFTQVLEAGKHLITDKPIGKTAVESQQIADVAKRTGRQLSVFYQNRALTPVQDARRFVGQGLLGELVSVELRMITTQVQFRNPQHWLFNQAQAGGGILSWLGCHYIDMIRYVTGDEIVAVSAEVATRSGEAIDVEDVATLALRFRSGAIGSLHAGYMMALSGSGYHNKAGYDTYGGFNGQLGRITWSSPGSPTKIVAESIHPAWASAPQRVFDMPSAESPAYGGVSGENFMRGFIRAALGQGEAWTSGSDALQTACIVDAAYESSRTGRRIEIATP